MNISGQCCQNLLRADEISPSVARWCAAWMESSRILPSPVSSLVRDVLQIFVRAVFSSICRRAGIPASNRRARCGAVTFMQRFSDALNLDRHFHSLALDGIYVEGSGGKLVFRHAPPPSDAEVALVADRVRRGVLKFIARRGLRLQSDAGEANLPCNEKAEVCLKTIPNDRILL